MAVLGDVPDILSQQQQVALQYLAGGPSTINLTYEQIEQARREYSQAQYQHLITSGDGEKRAQTLQEIFLSVLSQAAQQTGRNFEKIDNEAILMGGRRISANPMDDDFVPLIGRAWSAFQVAPRGPGRRTPVVPLKGTRGETLALLLKTEAGLSPLTTDEWARLFRFLFLGDPIDISGLRAFPAEDLRSLLEFVRTKEAWIWPNHGRMACLSDTPAASPSIDPILGDPIGFVLTTGFRVPQANDLRKVSEMPLLILDGKTNRQDIALHFGFHPRQADYYVEAAELLGLVIRSHGEYEVTEEGLDYCNLDPSQRKAAIARRILDLPLLRRLFVEIASRPVRSISRHGITALLRASTRLSGSTPDRRSQTIFAWLRFVAANSTKIVWDGDTLSLGPEASWDSGTSPT